MNKKLDAELKAVGDLRNALRAESKGITAGSFFALLDCAAPGAVELAYRFDTEASSYGCVQTVTDGQAADIGNQDVQQCVDELFNKFMTPDLADACSLAPPRDNDYGHIGWISAAKLRAATVPN